MSATVVVTGAASFVGAPIAQEMVKRGYNTIGTARDAASKDAKDTINQVPGLTFRSWSNLNDEAEAMKAFEGAKYVVHAAAPFYFGVKDLEEDMVKPHAGGAKTAVCAAYKAGAEVFVLIASTACNMPAYISPTDTLFKNPISRNDTYPHDKENPNTGYEYSKLVAEQEATKLYQSLTSVPGARPMRFVVIRPGIVMGPPVTARVGTSIGLMQAAISGAMDTTNTPPFKINPVDTRDHAATVAMALTNEKSNGPYLCAHKKGGGVSDFVACLKNVYPGRTFTTFNSDAISPEADITATEQEVWDPGFKLRPPEETMKDMAARMTELGLLAAA